MPTEDDLTEPWMGVKDRGQMRVMIIALPVNDDADIFDVQAIVNEAFPTGGDDSLDSAVYASAHALADDLGWEV